MIRPVRVGYANLAPDDDDEDMEEDEYIYDEDYPRRSFPP